MKNPGWAGVGGFFSCLLLFGTARAAPAPGQHLFQIHCAPCHGAKGEGARGPTLAAAVLPRAPDDAALLKIITAGIPGTEMPKFELAPEENQSLVAWVRHLGEIPPEPLPGDPGRGERVYRDKGNCALCHQMHGYGGAVGPDLTDVGRRRSIAYLRIALLSPGAAVPQSLNLPQNFLMVTAVFPDRSELTGIRVNEDTFSIQIRDLTGQLHSYYKSELADLKKDWGQSPMPSYAGALTPAELGDLIAFLATQKGPP